MRKLTALLLTVTLIIAPVSSMVATAFGFSGEHVHYDRIWHTAAEWAQPKVDRHEHAGAAHPHPHPHEHEADAQAGHDSASHHDADAAQGPIKHSHPEQVHVVAFVTAGMPQFLTPDIETAAAMTPASFPVPQHPHPPLRPPQAVLTA